MAKTQTKHPILRPFRSAQARVRKFAFRTTMGPTNANPYADESFPYSKRPQADQRATARDATTSRALAGRYAAIPGRDHEPRVLVPRRPLGVTDQPSVTACPVSAER